jgi:hypothetical protein
MRDALPELGVQARIGVNTGEVVTGTEERLATGDAVNVAGRLEQAADPGEILLGAETLQLVREAVEAEPVPRLELKGKAEPVAAHRLVAVTGELARRHEARFVGRTDEVELLRRTWQTVLDRQHCELVTLVGDAGVGKSRLTAEFVTEIEAQVVRGRCLPYGEGITYWPVVEVIKQLDALPCDPDAAESLRVLLGESDQPTSSDEIAWAFRKLLEEHSPLVCVFDDIQWGEATFFDLIEHVALLSSRAPILLLCMARLDLTERRPEWPVAVRLGPLEEDDVDSLLPETIARDVREKIGRTAGGNPLFVTEMAAMAHEIGGEIVVPPTLRALLAARLDQLESSERSVLERGAVEGEVFHRGAVQALSRDGQVMPHLASLVRKQLIDPDTALLHGDDAFRFRHLLIRDAAYDALPKALRAELHERFADWLEERAPDLVELDEILGFHLQQATRYRAELGQPDRARAERAGQHLAAAAVRARWRGDARAAAPLLERALELTRPLGLDVLLELELAAVQQLPRERAAIGEETARRAREVGDRSGEALALVFAAEARLQFADAPAVDELERLAHAALPLLERAQDHAGLARVWGALGYGVANFRGRFEEWAHAAEQALHHSELAGYPPFALSAFAHALILGPRAADAALQALDSVLPSRPDPWTLLLRAQLVAMLGRFQEAWATLPVGERWRDLTGEAHGQEQLAEIAVLAGDHAAAAGYRRQVCDMLERHGDRARLSTSAPALGRSLCVLGRYDEAEPLAQLGRELGDEQDVATQMLWRQVQARVDASRGEHAKAERLAREAVEITERTDSLNWQGDALCDLAEVLAAAGCTDEAAEALEQALERYGRKKNLAMVAQVRPRLEELRARIPTPLDS